MSHDGCNLSEILHWNLDNNKILSIALASSDDRVEKLLKSIVNLNLLRFEIWAVGQNDIAIAILLVLLPGIAIAIAIAITIAIAIVDITIDIAIAIAIATSINIAIAIAIAIAIVEVNKVKVDAWNIAIAIPIAIIYDWYSSWRFLITYSKFQVGSLPIWFAIESRCLWFLYQPIS